MNGKTEHTNKRMKRPQGGLQTQQGACGCRAGAFPCLHGEEGRVRAGRRGAVTFGVGAAAAVYVSQATNTV